MTTSPSTSANQDRLTTLLTHTAQRSRQRRYSLFLRPEDGLVVGYFESDDTAAAMRAMEDSDVNTRWQAEMAQYFVQPNGGTPEILAQYFHLA